jgi:hypothetical protein
MNWTYLEMLDVVASGSYVDKYRLLKSDAEIPRDILLAFAQDDDDFNIRWATVEYRWKELDKETLKKLEQDPNDGVRGCVMRQLKLP